MGTIAQKLQYTANAVNDIQSALVEKGVEVANTDALGSYGDKIRELDVITKDTVFKPFPNFIKIKPWYVRKCTYPESDTSAKTYETTLYDFKDDANMYRMCYGAGNIIDRHNMLSDVFGDHQTRDDNIFVGLFSRDTQIPYVLGDDICSEAIGVDQNFIDNFIPKFNGYYVQLTCDASTKKRKLATLSFSYVQDDSNSGLSDEGIDSNGIQFYNTGTIITESDNVTDFTQKKNCHKIYKLSDDVGIVLYWHESDSTYLCSAKYLRMFRVNKDGSIKIFKAFTVVNAESSTTSRDVKIFSSLGNPNALTVVVEIASTSDTKYEYFNIRANLTYDSTDTGMSLKKTTNSEGSSVNWSMGSYLTYGHTMGENNLAVFARTKYDDYKITTYAYYGYYDTGVNVIDTKKTISDILQGNSYVVGSFTPYSNGIDCKIKTYLIGRDYEGNYMMRHIVTNNSSGEIISNKIILVNYDPSSGTFYEIIR